MEKLLILVNFIKDNKKLLISFGLTGLFIYLIKKYFKIVIGNVGLIFSRYTTLARFKKRPKKIFLIRHGESEANVDAKRYDDTPDNKIQLSPQGKLQAKKAAENMLLNIPKECKKVKFFVSPFTRTKQTAEILYKTFEENGLECSSQEDPRLREQEMGNYQNQERMKIIFKERHQVGKFFYRVKGGESGADVYDRASQFLETLFREMDMYHRDKADILVIVTHGLYMRLLLMRYFKWSVQYFEKLKNPENTETWMLEKNLDLEKGKYKLITEIKVDN